MQKYKINMELVKKYDSIPPYIKLVRKEIKDGNGYVEIIGEKSGNRVEVGGYDCFHFMGGVFVPVESLTEVKA